MMRNALIFFLTERSKICSIFTPSKSSEGIQKRLMCLVQENDSECKTLASQCNISKVLLIYSYYLFKKLHIIYPNWFKLFTNIVSYILMISVANTPNHYLLFFMCKIIFLCQVVKKKDFRVKYGWEKQKIYSYNYRWF